RNARLAADVAHAEAQPAAVGVAANGPEHRASEGHPLVVTGELARAERRGASARDRRVEKEDREHGRDGQRDHEPHSARRPGIPRHGAILPRKDGTSLRAWARAAA